jgi:hypothetical protein
MRRKWRNIVKSAPAKLSSVVLDFVYGEPLPQPEVVEGDTETAWQRWLDAVSDADAGADFEPTRPMAMH